MKYKVKISYKFYGEAVVEAENEEHAYEIADAMDLDDFTPIDIRDFSINEMGLEEA